VTFSGASFASTRPKNDILTKSVMKDAQHPHAKVVLEISGTGTVFV
jgi:hypothetical protein